MADRRVLFVSTLLLVSCGGGAMTDDAGAGDAGVNDLGAGDAGGGDLGGGDAGGTDLGVDLAGCPDADGDGHRAASCGGDDCDDTSALRAPGHTEVCDAANVDEDCDPTTFGARDDDMDGFVDAHCCNGTSCGDDCNDASPRVHPGAVELCNRVDDNCNGMIDEGAAPTEPEVCNGIDDNCNGMIDEGVTTPYCADADHDLFGDSTMTMSACTPPAGYVANCTDCDDTRAAVNPGAAETCDGLDNDCNGIVDDGCACLDGSAMPCPQPGRCAAGVETCVGGTWSVCSISPVPEVCNGIDDDCNGVVDDGGICPPPP